MVVVCPFTADLGISSDGFIPGADEPGADDPGADPDASEGAVARGDAALSCWSPMWIPSFLPHKLLQECSQLSREGEEGARERKGEGLVPSYLQEKLDNTWRSFPEGAEKEVGKIRKRNWEKKPGKKARRAFIWT